MSFYESEEVKGHYFQKFLIKSILFAAKCLTWKGAYRTGTFIGKLFYIFRLRYDVAKTNLDIAYGDTKTEKEKKRIYHDSMINLGRLTINYMRLPFMGEKFWNEKCKFTNEHVLKELIARGKGVIAACGHYGMWDLAGGKLGHSGYSIAVVGKRVRQPVLNKTVIDGRNSMKLGHIDNKNTLGNIFKSIKRGEIIAMALDQNMSKKHGVFVNWLGRKASSITSASYVVSQTGAAVLPGCFVQHGPDEFELILGDKEVPWVSFPDDPEKEIAVNAQNQSDAFQKIILEKPELWFWIHKRYKLQPEGVSDPYKK